MVYSIAMLTVKDLAKLSSVSTRTIHYYDQIGLLKPAKIGNNGYRYYGQDELLTLQQILLYKELGLDLDTIKQCVWDPTADKTTILREHRLALSKRITRLEKIIHTIEKTIEMVEGEAEMKNDEIFAGFSEEQQEQYAKEAETMYDPKIVRESNAKWKSYGKEKQQQILAQSRDNTLKLAALMDLDPAHDEVQTLVQAWRDNMEYFWSPSLEQLIGLGELYNTDERFRANYEQVKPGLAAFFLSAIKVYVERHQR